MNRWGRLFDTNGLAVDLIASIRVGRRRRPAKTCIHLELFLTWFRQINLYETEISNGTGNGSITAGGGRFCGLEELARSLRLAAQESRMAGGLAAVRPFYVTEESAAVENGNEPR